MVLLSLLPGSPIKRTELRAELLPVDVEVILKRPSSFPVVGVASGGLLVVDF